MKVLRHILLITLIGSTLRAESWYSPYLQKIQSYFTPTTVGYATVGAAGGYVAHRANWNPCVGAACGLLLGLSAEKLNDIYTNYGKSEQTQPPTKAHLTPSKSEPMQSQPSSQVSHASHFNAPLQNPQKFYSDYQTIKNAVFKRFNSSDFENDFNTKYRQPTVEALIKLASHFDAVPRFSETWPVSATISIDGQKIPITGDIANIIYSNQDAINTLRQSYLE